MEEKMYLYKKIDVVKEVIKLDFDMPFYIKDNLNPDFPLRNYQIDAFWRFIYYYEEYPEKKIPIHLLFNMATGSGKTLIMAGLILYLYEKGYRNFIFFVNSPNTIEKTKNNFLNDTSSKYLFAKEIKFKNRSVSINEVQNFEGTDKENINIIFTTIQQLHSDLNKPKEDAITFDYFKDKKVVLISDEAHHIQTSTKEDNTIDKANWENTVEQVFTKNSENVLLEFTATMDFTNKNIEAKYLDKVIIKYDLRSFRNDGYSKDVKILQVDIDKVDRKKQMLIAILLSQYRQDVAAKYGISLKPVVLFKSKKIEQSKENKNLFDNLIENLTATDIEYIKNKINIPEINRIFEFYGKERINISTIANKLKISFAENKCLDLNNEEEEKRYQLTVNSLEDRNNPIRAIFAVQKLTEGWDVLNLFDIVRLYEERDARYNKPGKTTISEAQLIGRGARYFPFTLDGENKFVRKYDKDLNNELRIIEELHYHCITGSRYQRYISEITKALIDTGIIDEKTVERNLKLKDSFLKSDFYKNGVVYINKILTKDYSHVRSLEDIGVMDKDFIYEIPTLKGKITSALSGQPSDILNIPIETRTLKIKDIPKHIVLNAIARKNFFNFDVITKYLPDIKSILDIITKKQYLSDLNIVFSGLKPDLENISNEHLFRAVLNVLDAIEIKFNQNKVDYIGSEFYPAKISKIFYDKVLNIVKGNEREDGQEEFVREKEWYVFNANYGTNEEKALVRLIDRLITENFSKEYRGIYLIRNELYFKIYNFDDGRAFEPDFVMFMEKNDGKKLVYQLFIEPKGEFIEAKDKWKEDFLLSIKEKFKPKKEIKLIENSEYKVIGLPFYNKDNENTFKNELLKIV